MDRGDNQDNYEMHPGPVNVRPEQGRESKGRLITPYRSAAFLRDVINLIPKSPVSCHWSSHKWKNLITFLHLLLLYTRCNSTNTFIFSSLQFNG